MTRKTLIWTSAALLGIVLTAALAWSASQLAGQRIGLSSEPLSALGSLAPPPPAGHTAPSGACAAAIIPRGQRNAHAARASDRDGLTPPPPPVSTSSAPPVSPAPAQPAVNPCRGAGHDRSGPEFPGTQPSTQPSTPPAANQRGDSRGGGGGGSSDSGGGRGNQRDD